MKFDKFHIATFCIFICISSFAQPTIKQGVFYLKLAPNTSSQENAASQGNTFSFSQSSWINSYEPIQKTSPNQRSVGRLSNIYKVQVDTNINIDSLTKALSKLDNVIYAEPIFEEGLLLVPNDPALVSNNQTYLDQIHAYEAWDIETGSEEVVIGIVDTGIDLDHDDLINKLYANTNEIPDNQIDDDNNGYIDDYFGYDFADQDPVAESDGSDHGTRVAGLAGAETNNALGIASVGYNSKISSLKNFQTIGSNSNGSYEAIIYAADNGYDVINLSWGSIDSYNGFAQDIINYAVLDKDVVIVAAAGNTSEEVEFYPASYDNVLSVSASNIDNDSKASFATFNYSVDLIAPGNGIYSTVTDNSYGSDLGTSLSAPLVAGTAALLRAHFPDLNARQIMEMIRVSTDPIYELASNEPYLEKLGHGRLNVFQSLTNTNAKSIRVESENVFNDIGDYAFYGDEVSLSYELLNYLGAISNGVVSFSSPSPYISVNSDPVDIGDLNTLEYLTGEVVLGILSEETPANASIPIRVQFEDESGYQDFQYLEFQSSPDFIQFDNGKLKLPMIGQGNLGSFDQGSELGLGLFMDNQLIATKIGLFIAKPDSTIFENLSQSAGLSDFFVQKPVRLSKFQENIFQVENRFTDSTNLTIDQRTFAKENGDFIILEYRLVNTSTDSLKGISSGLFIDWGLGNNVENLTYIDADSATVIAKDISETLFTAIRPYFDKHPIPQALDLGALNGNIQDISSFDDSTLYQLATKKAYDSAGFLGTGNNIANTMAADSIVLGPDESTKVTYLIATSSSLIGIQEVLDEAALTYNTIIANPPLLETFFSCEGASLSVDPASGELFRFFSDPAATNLIAEGTSFNTGPVNNDTSFYSINIDGPISDVHRIDITLVSQIADFTINPDTLYLDNPQVNRVDFIDNSFSPQEWLWDFGNGIQSTIQNPSLNFNEPGTYDIILDVINVLGCEGNTTKQLLVVERPAKPIVEEIGTICNGETVTINATNSNTLAFYHSANQTEPTSTGSQLMLGPILKDTCIYVTNIDGSFESLKTEVCLMVEEIYADFTFKPDATSSEARISVSSTFSDLYNHTWYLDQVIYSQEQNISIPTENDSYEISLVVTSSLGCSDSTGQVIEIQASPTPTISFNQPCFGEPLTLEPSNGNYFAFYASPQLDSLIKKGNELHLPEVSDTLSIYVVGLDDFRPSEPLEVDVLPIQPVISIQADPDTLYLDESKTAEFSFDTDGFIDWTWYINSQVETVETPIFYFNSPGTYEIILEATNQSGCKVDDTLQYQVFLERESVVLSRSASSQIQVFPNPVSTQLSIEIPQGEKVLSMELMDLSGKVFYSSTENRYRENTYTINTSNYAIGIYILSVRTTNTFDRYIIRKQQ